MSKAIRTEGTQIDITLDTGDLALTFAAASKTITRSDSGGSFVADGFVAGQTITGTSPANAGPFTVAGKPGDDGGSATLWAADGEGNLSLNAEARFG